MYPQQGFDIAATAENEERQAAKKTVDDMPRDIRYRYIVGRMSPYSTVESEKNNIKIRVSQRKVQNRKFINDERLVVDTVSI